MLKNIKHKTSKYIITFIIVLCLFFVVILLYIFFPNFENENADEITISYIIDDRISPLTNQGLILEINRIRHRGLLEKIMKRGSSWKVKPDFNIIIEIDGLKLLSKDESDVIFNKWDTILQDIRVIRDAEEEQESSEITVTIIENKKTGLLGLRRRSIEREKIHMIYNYRTGRWDGDDYIKDKDGYGHYVGEFFEIWFNINQNDFDHDGIPYWTEKNILHTNPRKDDSKLDPDNDFIPTSWEWKWGYDPFIWDDHAELDPDIDGLENIEEYQMEKWFADPFKQDIYIEVDGMNKRNFLDLKHVLFDESSQIVIERFCEHGINVYIDNGWPGGLSNGGGEILPFVKDISWDLGMMSKYYKHHFSDERKGIFRYLLICNNADFSGSTVFNRYDTIAIGTGKKETYFSRLAFTPRTQRLILASATLHELGHTLGILPYTIEGCDNFSISQYKTRKEFIKEWGNYKSVMNYLYAHNKKLVDYSDGSHGFNDQNDWENLYLPFFQIEGNVICEPGILPPGKDRIVDENKSIDLDGWEYVYNLSQELKEIISRLNPIDKIKCNWSVFIRKEEENYPSDRNLRLYAKPMLSISGWSLINEGYWHEINNIELV